MFVVFPCSRLVAPCGNRLWMVICALLGCFLCGPATAAPGQLDPAFGASGVVSPINFGSYAVYPEVTGGSVLLPNGSFVVGHACLLGVPTDNHHAICLKRYTADGQLDSTFGVAGQVSLDFPYVTTTSQYAFISTVHLARQPDGKVIAAAACSPAAFHGPFCIARFLENGTLDTSFNAVGAVPGTFMSPYGFFSFYSGPLALQSNGKIVIVGQCSYPDTMCVTRLTANGAIDTTFANAANGTARVMPFGPTSAGGIRAIPNRVVIDSSDRIVMIGTCTTVNGNTTYPCVGRLNANGSTDTTFVNPDTSAPYYGSWFGVRSFGNNATGNDVTIQSDGKLVFIGDCGNSPATSTCVTRLLSTGTSDPAFTNAASGVPGIVKLDAPDGLRAARALKLQTDGAIVFAGECSSIFSLFCVGRLNPNGSLDTTFEESPGNGGGIVQLAVGTGAGYATDVMITGGKKILLYGACRTAGVYSGCAARLIGGGGNVSTCTLNVDANNSIEAASDGTLIVRYLLGLRGDALTDAALGANPTRTGQALETYFATLNLDADGDGQALAMTDGLLILRAMLGLTGDALAQGATNVSHPNVRSAQQILTWIESTHGVACLP
jgi:uncharacterized delta-60 repeat protein